MEQNIKNTSTPTPTPVTATSTTAPATSAPTPAPAAAPAPTVFMEEELCGSTNILDTVHLKNLVDDLTKLYGTSVCTKVAKDKKVAAEKRLIEAIRANLDRYEG
ncbi:MAG: hypothetical protein K2M75_01820 [Clostridia bacterium]|nr:hypothetical protein [Clostridia bacterium]